MRECLVRSTLGLGKQRRHCPRVPGSSVASRSCRCLKAFLSLLRTTCSFFPPMGPKGVGPGGGRWHRGWADLWAQHPYCTPLYSIPGSVTGHAGEAAFPCPERAAEDRAECQALQARTHTSDTWLSAAHSQHSSSSPSGLAPEPRLLPHPCCDHGRCSDSCQAQRKWGLVDTVDNSAHSHTPLLETDTSHPKA